MKKYQLVEHPDLPSNLVLDIGVDARTELGEVYLEDDETDWTKLKVTVFEEADDYLDNLPEFEG